MNAESTTTKMSDQSQNSSSTAAGQAVYNPLVLGIYDLWVVRLSCSLIWRCPKNLLQAHYNRLCGRRHLDVGVGTGYFLEHAKLPNDPEVTLFDLNHNSLQHTAQRIARYAPNIIQGDILEEHDAPHGTFDSIAMNFLFHCLPDGGKGKWRALDHVKPSLAPGGNLFGSTIIGAPAPALLLQRKLMNTYNKRGIFSNTTDSLETLRAALAQRFKHVEIQTQGVVGLFSAHD